MTTRDELPPSASDSGEWINLRDDAGQVQATYHPGLSIIIIKYRGSKAICDLRRRHLTIKEGKKETKHDLTRFDDSSCQAETSVLR